MLIQLVVYIQVFVGNKNANSVVTNQVKPAFEAVNVRLHPQTWHRWISLRVELFGCPGILPQVLKLFFPRKTVLAFNLK